MHTIAGAACLTLALCAAGPAAAQIYKCPDAQGGTVIQQTPCTGGKELTVKPASGPARSVAPPKEAPDDAGTDAQVAPPPQTEAQRIEAKTQASMRERRRRDLNDLFVPRARAAMFNHRDECVRIQEALARDQYAYKQNLYGKTHAAQRAAEMAAEAATCDTRDRELTRNYDNLKAECQDLGGCVGFTP